MVLSVESLKAIAGHSTTPSYLWRPFNRNAGPSRSPNIPVAAFGRTSSHQVEPKILQAFLVAAEVEKVAYKLQLPKGVGIHSVFHDSLLKQLVGPLDFISSDLPPFEADLEEREEPLAMLDKGVIYQNSIPITQALVQGTHLTLITQLGSTYLTSSSNFPKLLGYCNFLRTVFKGKDELTTTLVDQCRHAQYAVQRIIESAGDNEALLFEALNVNDDIQKVLSKYEDLKKPSVVSEELEPAMIPVAVEPDDSPRVGKEDALVRKSSGSRAGAQGGHNDEMMDDLDEMIFGRKSGGTSEAGQRDPKKQQPPKDDLISF